MISSCAFSWTSKIHCSRIWDASCQRINICSHFLLFAPQHKNIRFRAHIWLRTHIEIHTPSLSFLYYQASLCSWHSQGQSAWWKWQRRQELQLWSLSVGTRLRAQTAKVGACKTSKSQTTEREEPAPRHRLGKRGDQNLECVYRWGFSFQKRTIDSVSTSKCLNYLSCTFRWCYVWSTWPWGRGEGPGLPSEREAHTCIVLSWQDLEDLGPGSERCAYCIFLLDNLRQLFKYFTLRKNNIKIETVKRQGTKVTFV